MGKDSYYTSESEAPGRWEGRGAERLSLEGSVTKSEFEAALNGIDPKTGEQLLRSSSPNHSAGWDMTFSAPKSVSVLWALSPEKDRHLIETAHRNAVRKAATCLENHAAWARRGHGGKVYERTAGLLMAQFDHKTSRDLDPQLHTHTFIFNLAPRHDGSWGAIVSRELYKAQKQAGCFYRSELATNLEKSGVEIIRDSDNFRVKEIPKSVERAYSKRRNAIEKAAETHGYSSPKGMELAALRTRKAKQTMSQEKLFQAWKDEAKALGFSLASDKIRVAETARFAPANDRANSKQAMPPRLPVAENDHHSGPQKILRRHANPNISRLLQRAASVLDAPSRMSGIKISLRERRRTLERD